MKGESKFLIFYSIFDGFSLVNDYLRCCLSTKSNYSQNQIFRFEWWLTTTTTILDPPLYVVINSVLIKNVFYLRKEDLEWIQENGISQAVFLNENDLKESWIVLKKKNTPKNSLWSGDLLISCSPSDSWTLIQRKKFTWLPWKECFVFA